MRQKKMIQKIFNKFGYEIISVKDLSKKYPPDFTNRHIRIIERVSDYTLTSPERIFALINSVDYIVRSNIEGTFVECGVWRGGSAMAMMLTLIENGVIDRDFYLYDTFSGMSLPTKFDKTLDGKLASDQYDLLLNPDGTSLWCHANLEEVQENLLSTGYPKDKIMLVKGRVEETLKNSQPTKISLLRLDTDWYESTLTEMQYLYPLLSKHGVLLIDDYGHWQGARRAVDEYLAQNDLNLLLSRIDYTGRLCVKT